MGLFSKHNDEHVAHEVPAQQAPPPQATAPVEENPRRRNSIFHRNRDTPHRDASPTPTHGTSSSSGNSAPNSPDMSHSASTSGRSRNLLQRSGGNNNNDIEMDPSIVRARERVMHAEASEREADRILAEARSAVNEARIEVKRLEEEAVEEARRAKIKAFHVKDISKRGNSLGRHLH
jgi:hypothetical protein